MSPQPTSRLLRTIRFDASDEHVFERAAEAGEWAVSGAFEFADLAVEPAGKARQAFRNGFLGTTSFARSTLVTVAPIDPEALQEVVERLADHFIEAYGAPSKAAARDAAAVEVAFAGELAAKPVNTLIAVERQIGPEGIVERFRTIEPATAGRHARIWSLEPEDDVG